ncbi:Spo0E family sporulation regulatory protein-aspartic acid phosphatase [Paenibacillus vandeheii]
MTNKIRQEINKKIEESRNKLVELVEDLGFSHPSVIVASQLLDELLNELKRLDSINSKHLRVEERPGFYVVIIDHGDISYTLSQWGTLDQAINSAKQVSDMSNRPKLHVYLRGKKIW